MVCRACGARTYWQHLSSEHRLLNAVFDDRLCTQCIRKGVDFRSDVPPVIRNLEVDAVDGGR
jgi:hypothetical protein